MKNNIAVLKDKSARPVVPPLDIRREHAIDINIPAMPHIFSNGDKWTFQTTPHFSRHTRTTWARRLAMIEEAFPYAKFKLSYETFEAKVSVSKKSFDVDWELRSVWTAIFLVNPESPETIFRGPLTPTKIALATSEVMYGGSPKDVFRN